MTAAGWARSAARSAETTTSATAPSLSWQQSSRRSGSAIIREDWWSSIVIGRPKKNAFRVGRGVPSVGHRHDAEVGRGGAVLVHVAARLHRHRRRRRGQPVRVGPGVVESVGVHLRRGPAGDLAEALARAFVEAAVADDDVGDAGRDGHRRLLHGRAGAPAAVVDPAEEPQLAHAQLAGQGDLRGGVHRERGQPVDVVHREPGIGQGGQGGLDRRAGAPSAPTPWRTRSRRCRRSRPCPTGSSDHHAGRDVVAHRHLAHHVDGEHPVGVVDDLA